LVICDPGRDLPLWMDDANMQSQFGVSIGILFQSIAEYLLSTF